MQQKRPERSIQNGHQRPIVDLTPKSYGFWNDLKTGRWVVVPGSSLRMLLLPIFLHNIWTIFNPLILSVHSPSPFSPLFFISHPTPSPTDDSSDPRYRKGWFDLIFLAYHIVFFSFTRQTVIYRIYYPIAQYFGIRKRGKLARFGEQGYATVYFGFFGAWGLRIMSHSPTWWYDCQHFWIDYPHWEMTSELKRYYLMQASYWCHQLIVLVLRLEKPRKDYKERVVHHLVTSWLIGWSYGANLTLIGNAVYASMDVPDLFIATTKMLNYLRWERAQNVMFIVFIGTWTYFRHYLNLVMLYSVYKDFDLIPQAARSFSPTKGVWIVWWMKWQIFTPLLLLQCLNLFWYSLIWRVFWRERAMMGSSLKDERSDDEVSDDESVASEKKRS